MACRGNDGIAVGIKFPRQCLEKKQLVSDIQRLIIGNDFAGQRESLGFAPVMKQLLALG